MVADNRVAHVAYPPPSAAKNPARRLPFNALVNWPVPSEIRMTRKVCSTAKRWLRARLESIESRRLDFWMNRIDSQLKKLEERRSNIDSHTRRLILRRADLKSEMHPLPANVISFPDRMSKASAAPARRVVV